MSFRTSNSFSWDIESNGVFISIANGLDIIWPSFFIANPCYSVRIDLTEDKISIVTLVDLSFFDGL